MVNTQSSIQKVGNLKKIEKNSVFITKNLRIKKSDRRSNSLSLLDLHGIDIDKIKIVQDGIITEKLKRVRKK